MLLSPCQQGSKYADYILCRGVRLPKCGVLGMILNSESQALVLEIRGVWNTPSLPLLPDSFGSRVVGPVMMSFMGQIDVFKIICISWYSVKKNPPQKQHKECKYECIMNNNL